MARTRLGSTNNTAADFQPAFSPDGKQIAFMSDRGLQGDMEIFVMNADGSGETRLTNNTSFEGQPTFSPDGTLIAFASDRLDANFEIYTMSADGSNSSNPNRLTNSAASESRPNFSPDGGRIAFRTDRDGNGEVYVMNANGTAESRLTNDPALDGELAFSPDGQRIAFRSHRVEGTADEGKADIWVMSVDGSEQTNLTTGPTGQFADRRSDWQPMVSILTVILGGSGTGSVTVPGRSCPGDCTETYVHGTSVTLNAAVMGGSTFVGWSRACAGTGACMLTMDADKVATAIFTPTCRGQPATIVGTNSSDVRKGTPGKDVIVGLGGNDKLSGLAANDLICGGAAATP